MEKYVQKISDLIKRITSRDNHKKVIVLAGLTGIALIFMSGLLKSTDKPKELEKEPGFTAEEYISKLQEDLKSIISSIKGAGEAKVLVTLESGMETVYATEEKKNKEAIEDLHNGETSKKKECDDLEKRYITVKAADGSEKALSVTQIQPTVKGVVVVCAGGDNKDVQERITNAVRTSLNITAKRVFVTR